MIGESLTAADSANIGHAPPGFSMKAANSALGEGILAACPDNEAMQKKLDGSVRNMSQQALKDVVAGLVAGPEAIRVMKDAGYITASIMLLPSLKMTEGDVARHNTPTNTQLLREVALKVLDPEKRNLEISVAIGGSEQPPSLRLPTYIQPALDIASIFLDRGIKPPQIRIFNAFPISSSINGLDKTKAAHRADQAQGLMASYIQTFHPELTSHVSFEELSYEEVLEKSHAEDAAALLRILRSDSVDLDAEEKTAQTALKKLRRAADKHHQGDGEDVDAIICGYAASHGLAFHNYGYPSVDGVIKIGGRGEAPFDILQQFMANRHAKSEGAHVANRAKNGSPQLVSLRNQAGSVPPYYPETSVETGDTELTVDNRAEDIPHSVPELLGAYAVARLFSAKDFDQLPSRIAAHYTGFLKQFLDQGQVPEGLAS
jgi:hypothetical protein